MQCSLVTLQRLTSVRYLASPMFSTIRPLISAPVHRPTRFYSSSSSASQDGDNQEYTRVAIDLTTGTGCRSELEPAEVATDLAKDPSQVQKDIECNQHTGNVNLHASMQSNVPEPYERQNRSPNHLNMPHGGAASQQKYLSNAQIDTHPSRSFCTSAILQNVQVDRKESVNKLADSEPELRENDQVSKSNPDDDSRLSQRERFKKAVREYGATVVVFHTSISLFTLGVSYLAVSSGVDVVGLMAKAGIGQSILESKLATGTSTFVVAYAAHKVFAPVRMACTLTATPFIVRYLRRVGVLKAPVVKS